MVHEFEDYRDSSVHRIKCQSQKLYTVSTLYKEGKALQPQWLSHRAVLWFPASSVLQHPWAVYTTCAENSLWIDSEKIRKTSSNKWWQKYSTLHLPWCSNPFRHSPLARSIQSKRMGSLPGGSLEFTADENLHTSVEGSKTSTNTACTVTLYRLLMAPHGSYGPAPLCHKTSQKVPSHESYF